MSTFNRSPQKDAKNDCRGRWSGVSSSPSSNPKFNVDDLFGGPSIPVPNEKHMLSSTIDPTGTAQHRDQSIFTFASKRQAQRSKNPNRHPRNAPHQPTTTHFPQQDKILEQNTAPGSYVPSYDNSPPAASISFGFSERLPKSSKLPGEGTANYNPLGMRGPGAHIFKGTCKWYNSQRGFGFIIPVRVHDRSRMHIMNAPPLRFFVD